MAPALELGVQEALDDRLRLVLRQPPACEGEVRTAGPAVAVRARADRDTITTGMGDVSHDSIEIVDIIAKTRRMREEKHD